MEFSAAPAEPLPSFFGALGMATPPPKRPFSRFIDHYFDHLRLKTPFTSCISLLGCVIVSPVAEIGAYEVSGWPICRECITKMQIQKRPVELNAVLSGVLSSRTTDFAGDADDIQDGQDKILEPSQGRYRSPYSTQPAGWTEWFRR